MKVLLIYILMISFFHQAFSQQLKTGIKRRKMLEFLIKNGELDTSNHKDLSTYDGFINERVIYKKPTYAISIFSIFSAHSRKYIALVNSSQTILLPTTDMTSEMDIILPFLERWNIDKHNLIKILFGLTKAYQYNIALKPQLIAPPPG